MTEPEITRFGAGSNGTRAVGFEIDGVNVLCSSNDPDNNDKVLDLAHRLAGIKPKLFGTGYVRQDFVPGSTKIWLLNKRKRGWGEYGREFRGWDELFRTFDLLVTGTGTDEHGLWWSVESRRT